MGDTMSLNRVWTPSGNYSGGSKKRLIVIHTMEGFTGANGAYDCAKYFQGDVGASSQVCIDNNRGKIWECVSRGNGAWTQCNFNSVSTSAEQSGYASWSRDYWLSNRENQLRNMADWIAEESKYFGIPITDLTASQAQSGSAGVCYHSELGSTGCGHSDPGSGWPIDKVLEWARGGTSTGENDMTPAVEYDVNGRPHLARIKNGKVEYCPPDTGKWVVVDSTQSGAIGGTGLAIKSDRVMISYTNGSNHTCTYDKRIFSADKWGWDDRG